MALPPGEMIFATDKNNLGYYGPAEDRYGRRVKLEGVCAAMAVMWIYKCLKINGDVLSFEEIGNDPKIGTDRKIGTDLEMELRQAAFEKRFSKTEDFERLLFRPLGIEEITRRSYLGRAGLRLGDWIFALKDMLQHKGIYGCILDHKKGAHFVGFKTGGTGNWCFDPNEGLFRTESPEDFMRNADYMASDYPEYNKIIWFLCALEAKP
jgi:hypothetical protein